MKILFALSFLCTCMICHGWEDHPDREDYKETDRLFKLAQKQTGADELEKLRHSAKSEILAICEKNQITYEEFKDVTK